MIKILIGGSPCTFWSIAQKNNRETEAEGLGWELFKNYLIAKEKFKPDLFLYENNKSAAKPIKEQISKELGVDLMYINSALVSAQNRQRFYAFNWEVEQPADRGILLKDVLENREEIEAYKRSYNLSQREMEYMAGDTKGKYSDRWTYLQKPGEKEKACCITANTHKGVPYNVVAEPVGVGYRNRREEDGKLYRRFETHGEEKSNALTTVQTDSMVAEPVRVGQLANGSQGDRVYSIDGKSVGIKANGGGWGAKTGLYAIPTESLEDKPIYEVKDGQIEIKGKKYPIKLLDGYYIIRKLTPVECERLQTLPDGYTEGVSDTQRYKGLGNGWTAEVIIHILQGALKDVPKDEEIVVLSMYDGIGTGRYCLDKMGFTNVKYFAYEIDKYAKAVAMKNYPDIIQMGDAFDLRHPDWTIGY